MAERMKLMTQKETAVYLGTTVGSLNTWRATGKHKIPYIIWGRSIRYRKEDLDAWIAEHSKTPCQHRQFKFNIPHQPVYTRKEF